MLKQLSEDGISTATCDVCSQDSVDACIAGILQQAGSIDVLINNAGVQATGPLVEQPIEYFQQVMDTNLTGAVRMTQAVVPAMLARGRGLVVNICSVSSYVDLPLSAVYCASKVALLSVTNCLRMEVQPLGVHVLAVTAGLIESEIRNNNKCDFDRYYGSTSAYHSIADAIQKRMDILAKDRPIIMSAQEAAEAIAAAIMRKKPPRELVTGGKARLALLGGFIQKWVWPEFVEGKFTRMFGLQGLRPVARS
ncbi:hypothetical protein CVIRNUC_008890 [Coccomyxa viridis]|uniref:Uncharacterized protein n=1 Tax=Coccomyxa viridis TaxID=1274662 RepID=A0AAV1IF21_9CHLO|nr:hypothetical protein CVIRNUC_008890 [Coccomyxa viridis]